MVTENDETCEPIFAKHSYGREDLLAMMGKNTMKPPLGIKRCPFYMDTAQTPIILMPFSDTEMVRRILHGFFVK
uniref:SERPIN domain-containing protein n=1 Tax=Globodera pallida TaxID=36090 RepID=A0A183CU16_GLOPA